MQPSVQRVIDAGAPHGITVEVREFPDGTRTAEDAARAVGVDVAQIVKSLVFVVDGEVVVALVSGANRVDERALAVAANRPEATVTRPDANTVREATGFAIGGVPPFGHTTPLATFVDRDLLGFEVVWAAAGTPHHVFPTAPRDLVQVSGATVADLKQ